MTYDLESMIEQHALSSMEDPFSKEEIDDIIKHMPVDKSPGPDGFNGLFMNFFWYLIKEQFYSLCSSFYNRTLDLSSVNTAYIALIAKVHCPVKPAYYRPISLISMAMKVITKILANRLQKVIIPLLHQNQYGFIKSRTIQDCIA